MDSFNSLPSLWDLSQNPVSFSQLPDDDFLALLQKQFPADPSHLNVDLNDGSFPPDGVNPQSLTRYNVAGPSPPSSDDSSPSPPSAHNEIQDTTKESSGSSHGRSHSNSVDHAQDLKRKASEDDFEEGPSRKAAHPEHSSSKKSSSRRKSTGNPQQDESRLLKRKEQNRAAQRAFRERKEKHVKDLEDQVASLEAKNALTQSENENLRDLLSRLQNENMQLRQAAFTFNVPRGASSVGASTSSSSPSRHSQPAQQAIRNYAFNFASPNPDSHSSPPVPSRDFDFNSLTTFDTSALNVVDDTPTQQTATDRAASAANLDFEPFYPDVPPMRSPYKTIASNPLFMSFAENSPEYDNPPTNNYFGNNAQAGGANGNGDSNMFDLNFPWASSPSSPLAPFTETQHSLDEIFGAGILSGGDYSYANHTRSPDPTVSPVQHANGNSPSTSPSSNSDNNSSCCSTPLTPLSSSNNSNNVDASRSCNGTGGCPKTKAELSQCIAKDGPSPFVTNGSPPFAANDSPPKPVLRKQNEGDEQVVACKGSNIPYTEKSDKNIEVLSAWRTITQDPRFKDVDINELCAEFTQKARCDGQKVVIEPCGIEGIKAKLAAKKNLA